MSVTGMKANRADLQFQGQLPVDPRDSAETSHAKMIAFLR